MLSKGEKALPEDRVRPAEEIKDPLCSNFSVSRTSIPNQTWKRR